MILLQLRLRATIHMLVRAGPVWVIICFHLRIEPEFRFVSFLPFFFLFLKRRLSYVVIWQCLILIATTLGIKWKATSTNHIVTELLVTEKASVLDLSSVTFAWLRTAFCDMWLFKLPFSSIPGGRGTWCLPWHGQNLWEFFSSPEIFFPLDLLLQL